MNSQMKNYISYITTAWTLSWTEHMSFERRTGWKMFLSLALLFSEYLLSIFNEQDSLQSTWTKTRMSHASLVCKEIGICKQTEQTNIEPVLCIELTLRLALSKWKYSLRARCMLVPASKNIKSNREDWFWTVMTNVVSVWKGNIHGPVAMSNREFNSWLRVKMVPPKDDISIEIQKQIDGWRSE